MDAINRPTKAAIEDHLNREGVLKGHRYLRHILEMTIFEASRFEFRISTVQSVSADERLGRLTRLTARRGTRPWGSIVTAALSSFLMLDNQRKVT